MTAYHHSQQPQCSETLESLPSVAVYDPLLRQLMTARVALQAYAGLAWTDIRHGKFFKRKKRGDKILREVNFLFY